MTLVKDIDLEYNTWFMIGSPVYPFVGTFDGNDYKIMGLQTSIKGYKNHFRLFGYVDGGLIINVVISDPIIDGYDYTGALAGYIKDSGISNIKIIIIDDYDSVVLGSYFVGGIVGYSENSIIENVYNEVSVGGASSTGGIVGHNGKEYGDTSEIIDAVYVGDVFGSSGVGGITGVNYGVIMRALNSGDITGEAFVGGSVGYSNGRLWLDRNSVEQAVNTGYVKGVNFVGGIGGFIEFDKMSDIYNTRTVKAIRYASGGIFGLSKRTEAKNLYSSAEIIENRYVGGLVGIDDLNSTSIKNGYYNFNLINIAFGFGVGLDN